MQREKVNLGKETISLYKYSCYNYDVHEHEVGHFIYQIYDDHYWSGFSIIHDDGYFETEKEAHKAAHDKIDDYENGPEEYYHDGI